MRTGPRNVDWRPGTPATLVWAEALDGGEPRNKAERQDRVVTLAAPFTAEPTELARLAKRYAGLTWDTQGMGFLQEYDRERRWSKTWIVDANKPGTAPVLLFDRSAEERYSDPGFPLIRLTPTGDVAMQRSGDWIYFTGTGASPQGETDPLVSNGLGSPLCTDSLGASQLPAASNGDEPAAETGNGGFRKPDLVRDKRRASAGECSHDISDGGGVCVDGRAGDQR